MADESTQTQASETTQAANGEDAGIGNEEKAKEGSILERAQKIHDATMDAEKRIDEKIKSFETRLANSLLGGRAEMIPQKSQEEKDKEEAEKTVKRFLG